MQTPAIIVLDNWILRAPSSRDINALYEYKNDKTVSDMLVGYSTGYTYEDIENWITFHNSKEDEVLFVISRREDNFCVGHVGLYKIDDRVKSCEFGILIGLKSLWGKGVGTAVTRGIINYGFDTLQMNRIGLDLLEHNDRALALYKKVGFVREGLLRQAQKKNNQYVNLVLMSILKSEWRSQLNLNKE